MDRKKLSPMMQHYVDTKELYKDCILFYRLGDFYEMFFEDAIICSKVLDLILTGKDCGLEERAPMCGIPAKSVETYISKLLKANLKVAICEQLSLVEEKKSSKEVVQRDVTRVITPGTVLESNLLDERKNNFIMSIYKKNNKFGASYVDLSTGEFYILGLMDSKKLIDEIFTISPSEIIANSEACNYGNETSYVAMNIIPPFSLIEEEIFNNKSYFDEQFSEQEKNKLKNKDISLSVISSYALIYYLLSTQKRSLSFINTINLKNDNNFMYLDSIAKKNLEINETLNTRSFKGSLLWVLDHTKTGMGARRLKNFLNFPLQNIKEIKQRLSSVEELYKNLIYRDSICDNLSKVYDLERLIVRVCYGNANPKDIWNIYLSLQEIISIKKTLKNFSSKLIKEIDENSYELLSLQERIEKCINEKSLVLGSGECIKQGFNEEYDEYKNLVTHGRDYVTQMENEEREKTGIKTLRIKYNNIFGYFIEVPISQKEVVPLHYRHKQTLTNSIRFTTEELLEIEEKLNSASENLIKLERRIYNELITFVLTFVKEIKSTANAIGLLDVFCSLAICATKNNYVKPSFNENSTISIVDGRHPVIETLLKKEPFIPNDTTLDDNENRTMIITGPNMAGKSTYMRQVALITLMSHIGSFVPAKKCEMCIVDKIFTRIGASDDLVQNQSTFMVEMTEVSNIINNCTDKSLLILDEVGRGTSTFDGMSIASSVLEYLSKHINAKTLFSTHYHELTNLEGVLEGVKNFRINVREFNGIILFLRKIVRGSANKSFGIEVANMAGLPKEVIDRAKEIMATLLENQIDTSNSIEKENQRPRENYSEIINIIDEINLNSLTPIESFQILIDIKNKINEIKGK